MTLASRTVGQLITEARQLLNDEVPINNGVPRFPDGDLVAALNEGVLQIRAKRPDAFLRYGLRKTVPIYAYPRDQDLVFSFDDQFYSPLLFYVVGRSELTEDTFSEDGRAVALMSKFTSMLLKHSG
jgi:hypothetical protein